MANRQYFLGRQPILNRKQQIIAFELLFRSAESLHCASFSDVHIASASVIVNTLAEFGFEEVLGRHRGFFNVSYEMLMSDLIELLPREQVVIELLETIEVTSEVVERCKILKDLGFSLALDDHVITPEFEPLYELVEVVKLDILQFAPGEIPGMLDYLRKWPVKLLAEKVETVEQYDFCSGHGFDYFQGYYFARPVVLKQNRLDVAKLTLLQLLEKVLKEAEIDDIEETFKLNPGLTFNLLRLVNSVGIGLRERIKTLRHALMVLGLEQLKRWITLALYGSKDSLEVSSPLLEIAAVRGKLMELMIKKRPGSFSHDYPDQAFMTGVLSLIDVLFEVPMVEIVDKLSLAEDIREALLERSGNLGTMLLLVERLEQSEFKEVNDLLQVSGFTLDHLLESQYETINWANSLNRPI
jgi:EAL and modified HD-GYP domain-containing signal transduction protein